MTNVPYGDIEELKAVDTPDEANTLIKQGWAFLKHYQRWSLKLLPNGGGQVTQDKFLLGRNSGTPTIPTRAISPPRDSFVRTSKFEQPEPLRSIIAAQTWKTSNGGEWCFAIERDGAKRQEVFNLILAIERSPQEKLFFAGHEYTLSPKTTKKFIRRRKVGEAR